MIWPWNRHLAPAASETLLVRSWKRFCIEKYNISRSGYLPKCHQMLRLPRKVTLQLHQILRLPRKMNLMIDPRRIWTVIYNARSKHSQPPTSPNTAPATNSVSSRFQRKLREVLPPIERRFEQIPRIIRGWNRHLAPAASETLLVPSWRRILYGKIQHFAFRLSPKMSPNAAPATKSDTPTSPNTAPATQNESHDWSASHMKRHLQCAEQAQSASNLTKYCACHEICKFKISAETPWSASANRKTIRADSEDNPRMKSSSRTRRFGDLTRPILETHFVWKNTIFRVPASSQNVTKCCACHEKWHSNFTKYCACHEKCTLLFCIYSLLASILSWHLFSLGIYSLSLGIYSLLASILSWHLFSLGIYSLLASILSWHLFSLGIYSLLASILSWHLFSLGIFSLLASILSWHLFPLGIYSLLASILSWHLFSLGIYSLLASILSWHLFSLGIYSLLASFLSWHLSSLGIYSLLASIL